MISHDYTSKREYAIQLVVRSAHESIIGHVRTDTFRISTFLRLTDGKGIGVGGKKNK